MSTTKSTVKRAFKYRFYPTDAQAAELSRTFGCVRLVYNRALDQHTTAWFTQQRRITYNQASAALTEWKKDPDLSFLNEVSSVPLQQGLRHLQTAFRNFFDKRAHYPRFKYRNGQLTLAKMSSLLDIVWSRPLPEGAVPSTVTVSKDSAGRWFVSILCQDVIDHHAPTDRVVGVDAGITSLVSLSTGQKVTNPRHERRDRAKLAKAQRELSRKQKGSANRAKARKKVARVHARITDRRKDFLHKLSTRLVRENQVVVIEDLSVRNMVRNHSLARAISDASWTELRTMLEYKASWYGRELVAIDRFFPSSKLCSACGKLQEKLPLNVRTWTCECGVIHDRDVNATINIKAAGPAVSAGPPLCDPGEAHTVGAGAGVRPQRESSRTGRSALKQEGHGATRDEAKASNHR